MGRVRGAIIIMNKWNLFLYRNPTVGIQIPDVKKTNFFFNKSNNSLKRRLAVVLLMYFQPILSHRGLRARYRYTVKLEI